jgi:ABC-type dipeptide/oligopeptide/nickel transport system permease subunit
MSGPRKAATALLLAILCFAFAAPEVISHPYDAQYRDHAGEPPSRAFPLGTDELGRDRLARLAFATRLSVTLACAAAALSVAMGLAAAALSLSVLNKPVAAATTICLSLPWMFVFIILRGMLPLNTSPAVSIALTFGVMGVAGWALPARVFAACLARCREAAWMMQARACGMGEWRIRTKHLWPHVRAVAWAQFRALVPAYILAEAGLGLLGLGVAEPATSLGNLIAELQRAGSIAAAPYVLAPLAVLALITTSVELLRGRGEAAA